MPAPFFIDLNTMEYAPCLQLQRDVHQAHVRGHVSDTLLLVEHPHVLTFGRRAREDNVLVPESTLEQMEVSRVHIERGGDVTYHGPGQLIAYPIFALEKNGIAILDFVERLEEVMIRILKDFGISGRRSNKNRGVWVQDRKIGFVGIAVKRGISLHGLALNVNPALHFFQIIHPCGLQNAQVTSMVDLLVEELSIERIKSRAVFHFQKIFDMVFEPRTVDDLRKSVLP